MPSQAVTRLDPKAAREAAGLRQVDVASRAQIGLQTVIRAEKSGKYPRSIPLRAAYIKALGLEADPEVTE